MYFQDDKYVGRYLWYDEDIDGYFKKITKSLHAFSTKPNNGAALLAATEEFHKHIKELVGSAQYKQTSDKSSSLAESGCWHTSIANMLTVFKVCLVGRQDPSPRALLKKLQKEMLGTLTGYVSRPFMDPLSIITKGEVQLAKYRDFGPDGVVLGDSDLTEFLATTNGVDTCAIVNVQGHEFQGTGDSHYLLVKRAIENDYEIIDPGCRDKRHLLECFSSDRIYQISIYKNYGKR